MKKLSILFTALLFIILSCTVTVDLTSINLTPYLEDLVKAIPTTYTFTVSAKSLSDASLGSGADSTLSNVLIDTSKPPNIIGQTEYLDTIIEEVSASVGEDNTANSSDATVLPVSGGSVTFPFFGDAIAMDYAVSMFSGSKCTAYKIEANKQSVVQFHTGDSAGGIQENVLTYGVKTWNTDGTLDIDIWNALLAVNDDGTFNKSWTFKISTEGVSWFELNMVTKDYSSSIAGDPNGYFLIRGLESTAYAGDIGRIALWHFDGTTYTHTSIGNDIAIAKDDGAGGAPYAVDYVMQETDITNPGVDAAVWTRMVAFINTIPDPDAAGVAPEVGDWAIFNNDFLGF